MTVYERIIRSIDVSGLNELEVARLLYIELAKNLSFSTKFNNTSDKERFKMFAKKVDIDKFDGKEVNCVMWAQLYSQLLDKFGIKNEVVNMGHKYVEFYVDGTRWVADATYTGYTDLSRIHNSDDTVGFGVSRYQNNLDKHDNMPAYNTDIIELLRNIDNKINYNDEKYKDLNEFKDILDKLRTGEFDINNYFVYPERTGIIEKKLQFIFAKLGVLGFGYYENKDFIYELEGLILDREEFSKVCGRELKKTRLDGTVNIVEVITVFENNEYHYYLCAPNLPIKEVKANDIVRFAMFGYGKDEDKEIPGIVYPKNFEPGTPVSRLKNILDRFKVNDNIYEYAYMGAAKTY